MSRKPAAMLAASTVLGVLSAAIFTSAFVVPASTANAAKIRGDRGSVNALKVHRFRAARGLDGPSARIGRGQPLGSSTTEHPGYDAMSGQSTGGWYQGGWGGTRGGPGWGYGFGANLGGSGALR